MYTSLTAGTDYFPVRADTLFNCQTCVVDNDSITEIAADEDEVSILPPIVTVKTEAVENYSLCSDLDAEQVKIQSAVLNKFEHVIDAFVWLL